MKIPTAKLPFATKKPRSRPFTFRTRPLTAVVLGTIIDEYDVGMAHVVVSDSGEKHTYSVQEPPLSETEQDLYSLLMESLYYSLKPIETEDPTAYVDQFIWQAAEDLGAVEEVKISYNSLKYYIMRDSVGYGVVDVLVRDDDIEEISCEGFGVPLAVVHRRYPQFDWLDTNIVFDDEETLKKYVQRLVQKTGKAITTSVPFVDAVTRENHRLAATLSNEISLPGSTFDIRKFPKEPLSIGHLLAARTISALLAAYYWMIMEEKGFVLVIGPTASGKTTTMNALITLINPGLKIATVEETPELLIPQEHWERLHSRTSYSATADNRYDVDLFDLAKLTLRLRPDYIVVGEARGEEISTLFQAASTGHGALSSFHADSPEAALVRMAAPPLNVGTASLMLMWSLLMMNRIRMNDGSVVRRALVSKEVEMKGELIDMFRWSPKEDTILPADPLEIAQKSYRLQAVAALKGWSVDALAAELAGRAKYLSNIVRSGAYKYADVSAAIHRFYREKYGGRTTKISD
ncbi:MAG: type II/IV secretion system ATPase subunit [Nitrososphaerota archaeon]|nr:type II/IV secretion system ATPase subunit [Nitrososphaerota archaeon]